jgi:hypothetical protein
MKSSEAGHQLDNSGDLSRPSLAKESENPASADPMNVGIAKPSKSYPRLDRKMGSPSSKDRVPLSVGTLFVSPEYHRQRLGLGYQY